MPPESAKIIAVANQKGGVGKTTTAVNLAACLAHLHQETLLIDIDPQANATSGLGVSRLDERNIYRVLCDDLPLKDAIQPTGMEWLDIVPSHVDLVGAELELVSAFQREFHLKTALENIRKSYRTILIDCPPSLGLLTLNALCAADLVLVPVQPEYYALEGLAQLIKTIELVKRGANPRLDIAGVILTMFDARSNLPREVVQEIVKFFGPKVFETRIPRNIRLAEAPSHGKAIIQHDPHSAGAKAYTALAEEFLRKMNPAAFAETSPTPQDPPSAETQPAVVPEEVSHV